MKNSLRVHAALFFVALIYAANYSLSKDVMPRYLGPFGIVTLRIGGALLFFSLVSQLVAPQDRITGRADNLRAQRLYQSLGFTVDGRAVRAFQVEGTYHDELLMGLVFP